MAYQRTKIEEIQRSLRGLWKGIVRLLWPKWLRNTTKAIQTSVKKAESSVTRSTRKATREITKSVVGRSATSVKIWAVRFQRMIWTICVTVFKSLAAILQFLVPQPVRRLCNLTSKRTVKVGGQLFGFVGRWFKTRNYWKLIGGMPATLLAAPVLVCLIRLPFHGFAAKASHYRAAANDALKEQDLTAANLCFRKLQQLGGWNEIAEFQEAASSFEHGQKGEAVVRMKKLAPERQARFAPAHVWMAQWYMSGQSRLTKSETERLAARHVELALDRDPGNAAARALRAIHLSQQGKWDHAVSEMREVTRQLPAQGLGLAELYFQQGRNDEAVTALRKVDSFFAGRLGQEKGQLEAFDYLVWARVKTLLGDSAAAESLYDEGLAKYSDNQELREQAVSYFLAMAELANGDSSDSAKRHVEYLYRCFELDAENRTILCRIVNLQKEPQPLGDFAAEAVNRIIAADHPPTIVWSMIGTVAAEQGNLKTAQQRLLKAVELNPNDALTLNNAAWVQLQTTTDPELALKFSQRALRIEPENVVFRETRGQILLKLGRCQEAISDLEFAVNGFASPNSETHAALALAYEILGNPVLAESHRAIAKRLKVPIEPDAGGAQSYRIQK